MSHARVFVVQNPMRYDPDRGELVEKHDVSAAQAWGRVVYVLPPRAIIARAAEAVETITRSLSSFCDDDYLLPMGHPCFIGWSTTIAAAVNHGRVRFLVWSKPSYVVVKSFLPVQFTSVLSDPSGATP